MKEKIPRIVYGPTDQVQAQDLSVGDQCPSDYGKVEVEDVIDISTAQDKKLQINFTNGKHAIVSHTTKITKYVQS